MAQIHESIAAIIADCPAIGKNSKNQQQGFMYRGIDAVMNVFQPLFAKHKVFVVPEVLESQREERKTNRGGNLIYTTLKVKYTFYAADGSSVSAVVQGEGMDSADKSSNKAMSVAFKYACFQTFCIPTEEMKDPDAETPEPSVPQEYKCEQCGEIIKQIVGKSGKIISPASLVQISRKQYGEVLCAKCQKEKKKEAEAVNE